MQSSDNKIRYTVSQLTLSLWSFFLSWIPLTFLSLNHFFYWFGYNWLNAAIFLTLAIPFLYCPIIFCMKTGIKLHGSPMNLAQSLYFQFPFLGKHVGAISMHWDHEKVGGIRRPFKSKNHLVNFLAFGLFPSTNKFTWLKWVSDTVFFNKDVIVISPLDSSDSEVKELVYTTDMEKDYPKGKALVVDTLHTLHIIEKIGEDKFKNFIVARLRYIVGIQLHIRTYDDLCTFLFDPEGSEHAEWLLSLSNAPNIEIAMIEIHPVLFFKMALLKRNIVWMYLFWSVPLIRDRVKEILEA